VCLYYCINCNAMLYWQDMKNFVKQISIKFGGFYVSRWIWFKLCCRQVHQNIGENLYIGRYSKGQISADYICLLIFDLLNICRYTNFHRCFGVLVNSTVWNKFIWLSTTSKFYWNLFNKIFYVCLANTFSWY